MTNKCGIFAEQTERFEALKSERAGKLTLRTNPRTLENREQGRAKPNAQAAQAQVRRWAANGPSSTTIRCRLGALLGVHNAAAAPRSTFD